MDGCSHGDGLSPHLEGDGDGELAEQGEDGEGGEEGADGGRGRQRAPVRPVEPEEGGDGGDEEEIDVDELEVGEVAVNVVEDHDGDKLGDGVARHVLEDAKRCHKSSPTLPDNGIIKLAKILEPRT